MGKNVMTRGLLGGVLASALLLSACGGGEAESGDGPTPVTMGVSGWIGFGMWHIANDQDFDGDNGLDLDVRSFDRGADRNAALMSGELEAANLGTHYALMLAEQGADITIVFAQDVSLSADGIVAEEGIESVEDIAGLQVAYEEGQTPDMIIHRALSDHGMSIDDIEKVPMSASEAGAAFVAGRVPVAVTYEPYLSEARNAGANVIFDAGEHPGLVSDVLAIRNDFIESDPEAVTALIETYQAAYEFYDADEQAGREIIARALGSDLESLSSAFDGLEYWDLEKNKEVLSGSFIEETVPVMVTSAVEAGILETEPENLDELIDSSFVDEL